MSRNQRTLLVALATTGIVLALCFWWLNRGYGEVSSRTYEFSKALCSACQTKNEQHLNKVEELLASDESDAVPANERDWLEAIIAKARDGQWETAARKARRMMDDQVQY